MCKIEGVEVSIKKITFEKRGYITLYLEDGRIVFAPLKDWPDIKKLTPKQRNDWSILEGQYFCFAPHISDVFCIVDFLSLIPGVRTSY